VYDLNCGQKKLDPASRQCTIALGAYCAWVFFARNDMITTDHPSYLPESAPMTFFVP
jgi:hypothetical protein